MLGLACSGCTPELADAAAKAAVVSLAMLAASLAADALELGDGTVLAAAAAVCGCAVVVVIKGVAATDCAGGTVATTGAGSIVAICGASGMVSCETAFAGGKAVRRCSPVFSS